MESTQPYQTEANGSEIQAEIAIADLPDRYAIGKQAIYNRLEHLGIKPHKQGRNAFIWSDQLEVLDKLHAHLQAGGFLADFESPNVESSGLTSSLSQAMVQNLGSMRDVSDAPLLPIAIALHSPPDPLLPHRQLKEVAEQGWQITTSQLKAIIGVAPRERVYGVYVFKQSGRIGRELGWCVEEVK